MRLVQLILVTSDDPARLGSLVELADEMMEDPRCQLVIPATTDDRGAIASVWPEDVAADVVGGLSEAGWSAWSLRIIE